MRPEEIERMYRLEDTYWWFIARRALVRALLARGGVPEGGLVLDAGCGTGGTFAALGDRWRAMGVDVSPAAVGLARQRGMELAAVGNVEALPLVDSAFDAVVNCDVVEHLERDVQGMAEMLRVTKPGGLLVLTAPALPFLWSDHDEALCHLRRYTRRELRDKLTQAGWRVEWLNYSVSLLLPAIAAVRIFRRARRGRGAPKVDLFEMPPLVNATLEMVCRADNWLATRVAMPPGASLVALARRPQA